MGNIKEDSSSMDSSSVDYGNEDCEFSEDGSFIGEYVGYKRRLSMDLTVWDSVSSFRILNEWKAVCNLKTQMDVYYESEWMWTVIF